MLAALLGAIVGGTFILLAQALDFRRREIRAIRLLLLEIKANASEARKMVSAATTGRYPPEGPSPAFFSTRIWEDRGALLPEFLDPSLIASLTETYGYIESLVRSRLGDGLYPTGGWISVRVADVANRLQMAAVNLETALETDRKMAWPKKLIRVLRLTLQ